MPLDERELSYFIDILECIHDVQKFTESVSFQEFENDKMRKLAVERQLEVIGQAANKISKETQQTYPSIPWERIIGLRNRLAHDYGDILAKRIWDICHSSIQSLLESILKIDAVLEYVARDESLKRLGE